jgi:stringent starvation protein B
MSRQFWNETLAWATANGTAIASSNTETILFPNVTIPANYLQDGRALRVRAFGAFGTVVTANPSITFTLRWGGVSGTVIAKSAALLTSTSALGGGASMTAMWDLEAYIQTRANGSSGSLMTNGSGRLYSGAQPTYNTVTAYGLPFVLASGSTGGSTPVAVTVDLTADTALSLTATWSASNAANSIQGLQYVIEALN